MTLADGLIATRSRLEESDCPEAHTVDTFVLAFSRYSTGGDLREDPEKRGSRGLESGIILAFDGQMISGLPSGGRIKTPKDRGYLGSIGPSPSSLT